MKRHSKIALGALGIGALLLAGPLLLPLPQATGTRPAKELGTPESLFIKVNNLTIHLQSQGEGDPALVLLHGFGASLFSWRKVMAPLTQYGRVIAYDRPGFGLTSRPMPGDWSQDELNPYSYPAQAESLVGLLDALQIQNAVLIAHSAGASVAVPVALQHPDRIQALVLVDPYLNTHAGIGWTKWILQSPQMRRIGPRLMRLTPLLGHRFLERAWHDTTTVDAETAAGYSTLVRVDNWDRALWEFVAAMERIEVEDELPRLDQPVLIVTGEYDELVPVAMSKQLAKQLPNARLEVLPNCGHVPPEECPTAFLSAIETFLQELAP